MYHSLRTGNERTRSYDEKDGWRFWNSRPGLYLCSRFAPSIPIIPHYNDRPPVNTILPANSNPNESHRSFILSSKFIIFCGQDDGWTGPVQSSALWRKSSGLGLGFRFLLCKHLKILVVTMKCLCRRFKFFTYIVLRKVCSLSVSRILKYCFP